MIPLDSPQPTYNLPPADTIPDTDDDQPVSGAALGECYQLPALIFGAAPLSTVYNTQDTLETPVPLRTVRLALRYGIRAFDTSPYYGASEIILGQILQALRSDYPRSSYVLMTKCGRYGVEEFDYSPSTIRRSVERSLERLGTDYLDTVYLHDVEYVATTVEPKPNSGHHALALTDEAVARQWGLGKGDEDKVWGEGDQTILDAFSELTKMKHQGLIKTIGISGYPLPTLLRLALLILHTTGNPVDTVLSYAHYNLHNSTFAAYLPVLTSRANVTRVLTASPLNMGLLTPSPPPWHPAPAALRDTVNQVMESDIVKSWPGGLPNLALGFSLRGGALDPMVPNVIGLSSPKEVHEAVAVWREVTSQGDSQAQKRKDAEVAVRNQFASAGWADASWTGRG